VYFCQYSFFEIALVTDTSLLGADLGFNRLFVPFCYSAMLQVAKLRQKAFI
jgi:hypothetical protein